MRKELLTWNKLYAERKIGMGRCIEADRKYIKEHLSKLAPGLDVIREIPAPFCKGKIMPHVSRFVLSNLRTVIDVVHVKPVYYLRSDGQWRDMMEAFSWAGNKNLVLKYEYLENALIDFGYLNWLIKRCALLRGHVVYAGRGIPKYPVMLNTESTFFPDPDPETTSVDGYVGRGGTNLTWADVHDGAGTFSSDTVVNDDCMDIVSGSTAWNQLLRSIFLFDTSSIPDSDNITATVISFFHFITAEQDSAVITPNVDIYTSTPATNTALVNADYGQTGTTSQTGSAMSWTTWNSNGSVYIDFTFNATGRDNVSKTGVSKFALRNASYDVANSEPGAHTNTATSNTRCYYADQADTTNDPKLTVTHSAAGGASPMTLLGVG